MLEWWCPWFEELTLGFVKEEGLTKVTLGFRIHHFPYPSIASQSKKPLRSLSLSHTHTHTKKKQFYIITHLPSFSLSPFVTPRPPTRSQKITRNSFKDHRLAPQITTGFSSVLRPRLHTTWETSQRVTIQYYSSASTLNCEVLKSELPKKKVHLW